MRIPATAVKGTCQRVRQTQVDQGGNALVDLFFVGGQFQNCKPMIETVPLEMASDGRWPGRPTL